MTFNLKRFFFYLLLIAILSSCTGQNKSFPENVLSLEDFDFSTKITMLLPDANEDKQYPGVYKIKNTSLKRDTVFTDEFLEEQKPLWIEYRQYHYRNTDKLAWFDNLTFNTLNIATTLQNEIMVMNALVGHVEEKESQKFIERLRRKYGKAVQTKGEFIQPFDIYTWKLDDRIIKYVPVFDDESNTLTIEVNQENKTLKGKEKTPHYKGLLYLIQAKYADQTIGKFHTGDMLYCR